MDNQNPQNPLSNPSQESSIHVGSGNPRGNPIWQAFKSSKALRFGLPILLVALLPIVVLLAREQQTNQSRASAATTLSFSPESSNASPLTRPTGSELVLHINIDPGKNLVGSVKLDISYDPTKLALDEKDGFKVDTQSFPRIIQEFVLVPGSVQATVGIGSDVSKAIQKKTHVARLKFRTLAPTQTNNPTIISFKTTSIASSIGSKDQPSENVLATTVPAVIAINGEPITTPGDTAATNEKIKGKYIDKDNKPLTLPGMQAVLYQDTKKLDTVTSAPDFHFGNIKSGKYRLQVTSLTGFDPYIAICVKECAAESKLVFKRDYATTIDVPSRGMVNVRVKYVPNGVVLPTSSANDIAPTGAVQTTGGVCSPTSADVNKDGRVDNADYTIAVNCYNKSASVPGCQSSDIDQDKKITIEDYNCIIRGGQ